MSRARLRAVLALVLAVWAAASKPAAADAGPCRSLSEAGKAYAVCEFDLHEYVLRLFLDGTDGRPYGGLGPLVAGLKEQGQAPVFAMNAGMYQTDLSPVGLYVEGGVERHKANTAAGAGNFHLKPNGIFWVRGTEAGVLETSAYLLRRMRPDFATQSGPMLVIDGRLHPRFDPNSGSEKIRNGVGIRGPHTVVFAMSFERVTFTEFGELFRTTLGCRNALFLDGSISSLYAPGLDRFDRLWPAGPMVAAFQRAR